MKKLIILIALIVLASIAGAARTRKPAHGSPEISVDTVDVVKDSLNAETGDTVTASVQYDYPVVQDGFFNFPQRHNKDAVKIIAVILGITVPFGAAVLCLWLFLSYLRKVTFDRNRVVETAIREGRELPPQFFYILGKSSPERRFKSALMWIAWGLGLMVFFIVVDATPVVALMSIPVMIGVAKVVTYFIFDRKR